MCAQTAMCFGGMMRGTSRELALELDHFMGSSIPLARNTLVRRALERQSDALFWFDSDMIFPWESIQRLHGHDVPIVGATYRRRLPPYAPLGKLLEPIDKTKILHPAEYLPGGMMYVRREVYEAIPYPWYDEAGGLDEDYVTDDTFFCRRATAAGFPILCDTLLTQHVSHIGYVPVPWNLNPTALPAGSPAWEGA